MTAANVPSEDMRALLRSIYKNHSDEELQLVWSQLMQILQENTEIETNVNSLSGELWDASTSVLITYADGVIRESEPTLVTLKELVDDHIGNLSPVIHILPFLSSTSDGGFALSSHEDIESNFGDWEHLNELSKNNYLMADLVLNHVSASHPWVQQFQKALDPGNSFILSPSLEHNWDNVIRPRSTSLFTKLYTTNGLKSVWTTFGPDQVDLNWQNPLLLIEFFRLIIRYFNVGVRWIRLDAIGFIWKEPDTDCLNRNEVHQIVKLLRLLLNQLNSNSVLITETNVPEQENITYITSGDQANLAYNFPLPPLLLESIISNKADLLNHWLNHWPILPERTSFLNFTASHDGVGLRPIEGLIDNERFRKLLVSCEKRGGLISHRKLSNGKDQPYELNISWWSAMADGGIDPKYLQFERFLLSQLFVLSLQGIPAFYLQSILASNNDLKSFKITGQRRDLNRERFDADNLFHVLKDPKSEPSINLQHLKVALSVRSRLKAFHPESPMECLSQGRSDLVIILRGTGSESIWAIHNMTENTLSFSLFEALHVDECNSSKIWKDCLSSKVFSDSYLEIKPYSVHWLKMLD